MKTIKTYSELMTIEDYIERFRYLKIGGTIGSDTFGYDRYLNQTLYQSKQWKQFRAKIIARDNGHDMGHEDYDIGTHIIIHHINPITITDILNNDPKIFDPENVICVSLITHNAIHYGDESLLCVKPTVRSKNDTAPWRR